MEEKSVDIVEGSTIKIKLMSSASDPAHRAPGALNTLSRSHCGAGVSSLVLQVRTQ